MCPSNFLIHFLISTKFYRTKKSQFLEGLKQTNKQSPLTPTATEKTENPKEEGSMMSPPPKHYTIENLPEGRDFINNSLEK